MAKQTEVDLPPAGFARDEEMLKRTDDLAELADELGAEGGAIDPNKLVVENEIAQHFDPASLMLKVSKADSYFMYCWVFSGSHGLMVTIKTIEGWEVVQGNDEEAMEHKGIGADTTRRVGDTLLMRIPKDKYLIIERRRKDQANRFNEQQTALSERAEGLAKKFNIPIYNDGELDARTLKRMMNQAQAKKMAGNKVNQMIRQGRMPGMRG